MQPRHDDSHLHQDVTALVPAKLPHPLKFPPQIIAESPPLPGPLERLPGIPTTATLVVKLGTLAKDVKIM